jgi:hypothetical protein
MPLAAPGMMKTTIPWGDVGSPVMADGAPPRYPDAWGGVFVYLERICFRSRNGRFRPALESSDLPLRSLLFD